MGRRNFVKPFTWLIVSLGTAICLTSAYHLPTSRFDARLVFLSLITLAFGSRLTIQAPRANVHISVADTFVFLTLLLYGGEVGILLAAAEALCTSLRFKKKGITIRADTILFNSALMACSTFLNVLVLRFCFGPIVDLPHNAPSTLVVALCFMAFVQYVANSSLAAVYTACDTDKAVWQTWNKHYFCTAITYISGALAAGLMVKIIGESGIYSIVVVTPIIAIIYLTYQRYISDIKASASQAEQAERARAEQAELHVEELRLHIGEQERTSLALEESKEHFRHVAYHDSLTELPNRALFIDRLRLAMDRARQSEDYLFAVLFLDLDRFKNINDSLGHTYGDQLLIAIARRLELCLRKEHTLARFGGDEFAVLLNGINHPGEAILVAERIHRELMIPFNLSGQEAFTTASIGVALSIVNYEQPEDILRDADTAMYQAKDNGKARHVVFDEPMRARAIHRLQLETDLRRAVERNEFFVLYQPIVDLDNFSLRGFEALVRWRHPERGIVSPLDFIPMAEETGLIINIGNWVLREACRQMQEWHGEMPTDPALFISVNLSGKQFTQPRLISEVASILKETGLQPHSLKLEITETVVMENTETTVEMLEQLRKLGVQLSIDDFGTGYCSLSYLHRFPIDTLKIDRSFVSRMTENDENTAIVRTIIMLAQTLKLDVVAEGVETSEELALLRKLGCENGQGYYFSRPINAKAAREFIACNQENKISTDFKVLVSEGPLIGEDRLVSIAFSTHSARN